MEEVEAMDFYNRVVGSERETSEYTLTHESGASHTFQVEAVNRKDLLNEISNLPNEMLETISEAEDEEEATEEADDMGLLTGLNGDTITTFENICVLGLSDEELFDDDIRGIVEQMDFDVLFELGAEIIDMSFEETGSVTDFHGPSSDEN